MCGMLMVMKQHLQRRHLPGFSLAEVVVSLIMMTILSAFLSQAFATALASTEYIQDKLYINSYAAKTLADLANQPWSWIAESTKKINPDGSVAVDASGNTIYSKPTICTNPPEMPQEIGLPLNADGTPHSDTDVACQVEVWVAVTDGVLKAINVRIYSSSQGKGELFEYNTVFNENSSSNKD